MLKPRSKLNQVEEDARHLADSIGALIQEEGSEIEQRLAAGKEMAKTKWDEVRSMAEDKGKKVDEWAHENTWATAALSAAVGAVVAMLVTFKRKK